MALPSFFVVSVAVMHSGNMWHVSQFFFSCRESLWSREVLGIPQILQSEFLLFSLVLLCILVWVFLTLFF